MGMPIGLHIAAVQYKISSFDRSCPLIGIPPSYRIFGSMCNFAGKRKVWLSIWNMIVTVAVPLWVEISSRLAN